MAKNFWKARIVRSCLSAGAAALALTAAMTPARAGVGDEMAGYFNDMGAAANSTGAVAYQGQSAGYYSLGSMWARFPQKTVYPANIQLPKVSAGCGGIDIFTGSFSFINASEFVAMAKAIANNAVGFAFDLALEAISPQIKGVIDPLRDLAQKINAQNLSSCEQGAALVGGVLGEMGVKSNQVCQAVGTSNGLFSDWARSRQKCGNGGEQTSTLKATPDDMKVLLPGPKNYAWDMIKNSPLGASDRQMREFVMTLTGTIIVGERPSDNDPLPITYRGQGDPAILDALIDGDKSAKIMKCDEEDKCLSVSEQTLAAQGSNALRPRIAGLIRSMTQKVKTNQALTQEERNLLGVSSVPLYKIVAVQAASGFSLSDSEIQTLAEVAAIDMLNAIVQRMLDQVAAGQSNNLNQADVSNLRQFNEQVAQVRQRLWQRESTVTAKVSQTYTIINNAMRIESTLQSRMAPGMAASLNFSRALSAQGLRP